MARGFGKPCVAGTTDIKIDVHGKKLIIGDQVYGEGDVITLNGSTGEVFGEALKLIPPRISEDFQRVVSWADEVRTMGVRANRQLRRRRQGS